MSTFTRSQLSFDSFYRAYAPPLRRLIALAYLPPKQAETIFINTLSKGWLQLESSTPTKPIGLRQLIRLAYAEGLPPLLTTRRAIS